LSWCAYFIPFLFAYSPALVMQDAAPAVLLALALAVVGIFIATLAVVGYFMAPIPPAFRLGYAALAALTLFPAQAFPGAHWMNAAGVAAASVAIAREVFLLPRQRAAAARR
jgi:TRAP-type uncharacterized transport system fused permease subunit